jgi:hypothetical protein
LRNSGRNPYTLFQDFLRLFYGFQVDTKIGTGLVEIVSEEEEGKGMKRGFFVLRLVWIQIVLGLIWRREAYL